MSYQVYFDEEEYNKTQKQKNKNKNKAIKVCEDLYDILNPHRFINEDSIYGENNILQLINIGDVNTNMWPDTKQKGPMVSSVPEFSDIYQYQEQFRLQMNQYVQYAIKEKGFKSYDDIKNIDNTIDISREYPTSDVKELPHIKFTQADMEKLIHLNHEAFLPCFEECVIKIHKNRFVHCVLLQKNSKNKSYTYQMRMYCGDNKNWIFDQGMTIKFNFHEMNQNKLPMDFEVINSLSYEEFITMFMDDMNWSNKEYIFWQDMLSTSPLEKLTLVELTQNDYNLQTTVCIPAQQKLLRLENICKDINIQTKIKAQTAEEIRKNLETYIVKSFLPLFFQIICMTNLKINNCDTIMECDTIPTEKQPNIMYSKVNDKTNVITRYVQKIKFQSVRKSDMKLPKQLKN